MKVLKLINYIKTYLIKHLKLNLNLIKESLELRLLLNNKLNLINSFIIPLVVFKKHETVPFLNFINTKLNLNLLQYNEFKLLFYDTLSGKVI